MKFRSKAADVTEEFGAALASVLQDGDVIVLTGDLGAGKTVVTRGIARGLGLDDPVTSPTFAIVHHYEAGPLPLVHVDAWRLDDPAELENLGLEDVLDPHAVTVVEWGELVSGALPGERCTLRLSFGPGVDDRVIEIDPIGPTWQSRARALVDAASRTMTPEI